jgi:hypothetical protein
MLASLLLAGAVAATPTVGLDKVLAKPTTKVRSQTKLAILLPKRLPVVKTNVKLYATGSGSYERYSFRVTTTRDCTANFCFAATFAAELGSRKLTGRKVSLTKGRKGIYTEMSCGASCAPATIAWKERHTTYSIEAMIPVDADQRAELAAMANSAIRRGAR